MYIHPESYLSLDELGLRSPEYRPTFDFPQPYLNDFHRSLAEPTPGNPLNILVRSRQDPGTVIVGWLQPADALKLYEMAYFAPGDVLEMGSYHGLSTYIMARAAEDSGRLPDGLQKSIVTVDLDIHSVEATWRTLQREGLAARVTSMHSDAAAAVRTLGAQGKHFGFVFVDHSHAYAPVYAVCRELPAVIEPGAFCLFHDFNDGRNRDPHQDEYQVYRAVLDGLDPQCFAFCGVYGCTALYQRT